MGITNPLEFLRRNRSMVQSVQNKPSSGPAYGETLTTGKPLSSGEMQSQPQHGGVPQGLLGYALQIAFHIASDAALAGGLGEAGSGGRDAIYNTALELVERAKENGIGWLEEMFRQEKKNIGSSISMIQKPTQQPVVMQTQQGQTQETQTENPTSMLKRRFYYDEGLPGRGAYQ